MNFNLILCERAKSYNAKKKQRYMSRISESAKERITKKDLKVYLNGSESLYARVYYFHRINTEIDADNISKPIIDALRKIVYDDDKFVIKRIASIIDLSYDYIVDDNNISDELYDELITVLNDESENHIIFVEVGSLDERRVRFGGNI